jgi:hypothetical protein
MAKNTNWRVPARMDLSLLDEEQFDDLFVEAFQHRNLEAQSTFRLMVQSHPEKINGDTFFHLISHAVLNDDPHVRDFAREQVMDVLKARGEASPQLVKMALDARIVATGNKDPELRAAASRLVKEVESMFPAAAPPQARSTFRQRASAFLHLRR